MTTYELRWIVPAEATKARSGLYGRTVVEVASYEAARATWESLTDVDLFYPDGRSSASDPDVVRGELQDGKTLRPIAAADFDADRVLCSDWRAELVAIDQIGPHRPGEAAIEAAVVQAKAEILEDVKSGRVPADVPTFSALHDSVDANEYGGLCGERADWSVPTVAAVQDAVDAWIVAGGLREAVSA